MKNIYSKTKISVAVSTRRDKGTKWVKKRKDNSIN